MRRTLRDVVRDVLRRQQTQQDVPRTRIVTPYWARASAIVHPESDLSEWVHRVAERDWDSVKKGKNTK
jgi:hypothetical protein